MSNLVPFTNETDAFLIIGLITIPPGQTRSIESTLHPDYSALADAPDADQGSVDVSDGDLVLQRLLDGNVDSVLAAMTDLPDEELDRLGELEQLGKCRKGVLGSVAEHLLNRAGAEAENANGQQAEGQ